MCGCVSSSISSGIVGPGATGTTTWVITSATIGSSSVRDWAMGAIFPLRARAVQSHALNGLPAPPWVNVYQYSARRTYLRCVSWGEGAGASRPRGERDHPRSGHKANGPPDSRTVRLGEPPPGDVAERAARAEPPPP